VRYLVRFAAKGGGTSLTIDMWKLLKDRKRQREMRA
jgi:hypothetical protein